MFPPADPELRTTFPVREIGLVKVIGLLEVLIVPERLTEPAPPSCKKDPLMEVVAGDVSVTVPLLVTLKDPPFVVTICPFLVRLLRVRLMPPAPLVFNVPFNVVVPVPALCTMLEAVTPLVVTFCALEMVSVPRRALPPTAPVKMMLPAPAATVKLDPPLIVFENVIFCEAADVLICVLPPRVIGAAKETAPPAVI